MIIGTDLGPVPTFPAQNLPVTQENVIFLKVGFFEDLKVGMCLEWSEMSQDVFSFLILRFRGALTKRVFLSRKTRFLSLDSKNDLFASKILGMLVFG